MSPCWVRRTPDTADGRYTRRLVIDQLTKAQSRQLREIGQRITRAVEREGRGTDEG
jgi:hypothetical protein